MTTLIVNIVVADHDKPMAELYRLKTKLVIAVSEEYNNTTPDWTGLIRTLPEWIDCSLNSQVSIYVKGDDNASFKAGYVDKDLPRISARMATETFELEIDMTVAEYFGALGWNLRHNQYWYLSTLALSSDTAITDWTGNVMERNPIGMCPTLDIFYHKEITHENALFSYGKVRTLVVSRHDRERKSSEDASEDFNYLSVNGIVLYKGEPKISSKESFSDGLTNWIESSNDLLELWLGIVMGHDHERYISRKNLHGYTLNPDSGVCLVDSDGEVYALRVPVDNPIDLRVVLERTFDLFYIDQKQLTQE